MAFDVKQAIIDRLRATKRKKILRRSLTIWRKTAFSQRVVVDIINIREA